MNQSPANPQRMSDKRLLNIELTSDRGIPEGHARELLEALKVARAQLTRIQDILDDPSERNIHTDIQGVLDS